LFSADQAKVVMVWPYPWTSLGQMKHSCALPLSNVALSLGLAALLT